MSLRIPPALSPYIRAPVQDSLVLLTGVQNASANWLVLRYLFAAFGRDAQTRRRPPVATDEPPELSQQDGSDEADVAVLMVSWMRDFDFWRTEARRAVGVDLQRMQQQGRFAFVDGLTDLYTGASTESPKTPPRTSHHPSIPIRGPHPFFPSQHPTPANPHAPIPPAAAQGHSTLTNPTLESLESTIRYALSSISATKPRPTIVILDTPSLLLSTPSITSSALLALLLRIRALPSITSLILNIPADGPLVAASPSSSFNPTNIFNNSSGHPSSNASLTPLDTENAAFIVGAVYQASTVLSCRALGTGWADDVSGVLRISPGGDGGSGDQGSEEQEGGEWLYYIEKDGAARVWGRGGVA